VLSRNLSHWASRLRRIHVTRIISLLSVSVRSFFCTDHSSNWNSRNFNDMNYSIAIQTSGPYLFGPILLFDLRLRAIFNSRLRVSPAWYLPQGHGVAAGVSGA